MHNLSNNTKEVTVYTYSQAAIKAMGRVAFAHIVLADGSFISMLLQQYPDGTVKWRAPCMQLQQNGHVENFPTMGGNLLDEAIKVCETAQQRVKRHFHNGVPTGQTFKVTRAGVEQVPNPKEEPLAC